MCKYRAKLQQFFLIQQFLKRDYIFQNPTSMLLIINNIAIAQKFKLNFLEIQLEFYKKTT